MMSQIILNSNHPYGRRERIHHKPRLVARVRLQEGHQPQKIPNIHHISHDFCCDQNRLFLYVKHLTKHAKTNQNNRSDAINIPQTVCQKFHNTSF